MPDLFDVEIDVPKRLLRARVRGFWSIETVARYRDAVIAAAWRLHKAGADRADIRVLLDARAFAAQSQDVVTAYQRAFSRPEMAVRKVATLTSNPIFRLQARRAGAAEQRVFAEEAEALAWLDSDDR